jgi:hypothetical protein
VIDALIIAATPLTFGSEGVAQALALAGIFAVVGWVYTFLRFDPVVSAAADTVAIIAAITSVFCLFTYVMAHLGAVVPLWDARLDAADRALGLDWRAVLAWFDAHPTVAALLGHAYLSSFYQIMAAVTVLALLGHYERLQSFVFAWPISLFVCGMVAGLMPAIGAYAFYGIDAAAHHPNFDLITNTQHVRQFLEMRSGTAVEVSLKNAQGIITFPSFHTTVAIMFAWVFWSVPVLRWPALGLNIAMVAATPIHGGHYFVDLLGGAAVGILALKLAAALSGAVERSESATAAEGLLSPKPSVR